MTTKKPVNMHVSIEVAEWAKLEEDDNSEHKRARLQRIFHSLSIIITEARMKTTIITATN